MVRWKIITLFTLLCTVKVTTGFTIKIGLICNQSGPLSFENSVGAIQVGFETLQNNGILQNFNFSIIWQSDQSANRIATLFDGIDLIYNDSVDVIFGPPTVNSADLIGYLTSVVNLPWFSWQLEDPEFSDATEFPTLVKTTSDNKWIVSAITNLFVYYQWQIGALISNIGITQITFCSTFNGELQNSFTQLNLTISYTYQFTVFPNSVDLQQQLQQIKSKARIIIMCGLNDDIRNLLLAAYQNGLTTSDFVYYALTSDKFDTNGMKPYLQNDSFDSIAQVAYQQTFFASFSYEAVVPNSTFTQKVINYSRSIASNYNITIPASTTADPHAGYLSDAAYLYGFALARAINNNQSYLNAIIIKNNIVNTSFTGYSGQVTMGPNGDRISNVYFWCMPIGSIIYQPCVFANINYVTGTQNLSSTPQFSFSSVSSTFWRTSNKQPPPSTPKCGFSGENCIAGLDPGTIVGIAIAIAVAVAVLVVFTLGLKFVKECIQRESWIIELDQVTFKTRSLTTPGLNGTHSSLGSSLTHTTSTAVSSEADSRNDGTNKGDGSSGETLNSKIGGIRYHLIDIGLFHGELVAIKRFRHLSQTIRSRNSKNFLKSLHAVEHPNIVPLLGAHIADPNNLFFIQPLCSRGSLHDVMKYQYSEFQLDHSFKISFISDLIKGLAYIHESQFESHGNIKSCNCLIDVRWTLKLADFGLHNLRLVLIDEQAIDIVGVHRSMYWTSPELLRVPKAMREKGSQPGDIYSFAIILYEIIFESEPYNDDNPHEVVTHVRNGVDPPHRPMLMETPSGFAGYISLMRDCWAEDPLRRPTIGRIRSRFKELCGGKEVVLVDEMLIKMEKYMAQLEETVNLRTAALAEEKKKADLLLYRMLPQVIAESLKAGQPVSPESYECASVLFTDIVRFTCIAGHSSPQQIINFMNQLYHDFDAVISNHDAYKVETIGDAYMIVSGVPVRNGMQHAAELADIGLELLSTSLGFIISHLPEVPVMIRVGIDSGPCCSGVIGSLMPHFALFGDTVNTASRMESHGEALKIHITDRTHQLLSQFNVYVMVSRGESTVKGKGVMHTYWLLKKLGYQGRLPADSDYAVTYDPDGLPRRAGAAKAISRTSFDHGSKNALTKTIHVEPTTPS